jgi:hypothetical protein
MFAGIPRFLAAITNWSKVKMMDPHPRPATDTLTSTTHKWFLHAEESLAFSTVCERDQRT